MKSLLDVLSTEWYCCLRRHPKGFTRVLTQHILANHWIGALSEALLTRIITFWNNILHFMGTELQKKKAVKLFFCPIFFKTKLPQNVHIFYALNNFLDWILVQKSFLVHSVVPVLLFQDKLLNRGILQLFSLKESILKLSPRMHLLSEFLCVGRRLRKSPILIVPLILWRKSRGPASLYEEKVFRNLEKQNW